MFMFMSTLRIIAIFAEFILLMRLFGFKTKEIFYDSTHENVELMNESNGK